MTSLNSVTLTGNLGTAAATGQVVFTASNWLTDAVNQMLDPPTPVTRFFPAAGTFSAPLLATDNPSPLPAGWNWTATFQLPAIAAYSITFFLAAGPLTFTATDGTPCVFTASGSAYVNGTGVELSGGSLPAGFASGTTYYVVNAASDTFELSATLGGAPLASTSTGSGDVLTVSADISSVAPVTVAPAGTSYVPTTGGAMTGPLTLSGTPPLAIPLGAVSGYVWTANAEGQGSWQAGGGGGGGSVSSVFGRAGAVTAQTGDYTVSQVTGAAPLANPALSGTPTAPTASALTDDTQVATTGYADSAVAVETTRAETAEALALPKAGGTMTGALVPAVVTLTDAATIAVNAAAGNVFQVTLGGDRTLGTPSNPSAGQTIIFEFIQGTGGNFTLAFSGAYAFPASIPQPTLSTTAGQRDFLQFTYDSLVTLWLCTGWVPDQNAGIVAIAQGGSGQSTQQGAINALAGAQTSGFYLRGTGSNVQMSAIQAADLPAATTSAQGAVELEGTGSAIQPVGTAAAAGSTGLAPDAGHVHLGFFGGIFGTGADGAVTLDGLTTYTGFSSLTGSTYTLTRDVQATNLTVNNGITLKPAQFRIFCRGTLTNNGTITAAGNAASGATQGGATGSGSLGGGQAGGAGGTGASGTGGSGTNATFGVAAGNGGAGTSGSAGSGGTATVSNTLAQNNILQTPMAILLAQVAYNLSTRILGWGAGGGGGGSDASSNAGGGGGGGGGIIAILAFAVNNGSGTITVAGGNGANGVAGNAGGGGGGSGGLIVAYTLSAWTAGTLTVGGGSLGSKASGGTGSNGSNGGTGLSLNVVLS